MQRLIKNKHLPSHMSNVKKPIKLEERIAGKLDEAISLTSVNGGVILYSGVRSGNPSYKVDEEGVIKYWKGKLPNGDPITDRENLTPDKFLDWVKKQSNGVQQQVYHNLLNYINTKTSKEQGKSTYKESDYLFGY